MNKELRDKAVENFKAAIVAFAKRYYDEKLHEDDAVREYNKLLIVACREAGLKVEPTLAQIVYQGVMFDADDITPDKIAELIKEEGNFGAKVGAKYASYDRWGYVGSLLDEKGIVIKDCIDQCTEIERMLDFFANDEDKGDH